jgi:hypothetical protein
MVVSNPEVEKRSARAVGGNGGKGNDSIPVPPPFQWTWGRLPWKIRSEPPGLGQNEFGRMPSPDAEGVRGGVYFISRARWYGARRHDQIRR